MDHRRFVRLFASVSTVTACIGLAGAARAAEPSAGDPSPPAADLSTSTTTGAKASAEASTEASTSPDGTAPATTPATDAKAKPGATAWDSSDVSEDAAKKYYFVGMRYRGNVIPKFIENIFVGEGATVYSNSIGLEADIRKDGFSLIPALTYSEYGTGDILFHQQKADNASNPAGNYSFINSGLKGVYASVDLLWSTPIAKDVDFEYGFGVGVGVIFGDLVSNWVTPSPNGQFVASDGTHFAPCVQTGPSGCNRVDHNNATEDHIGNHVEKSWAGGGSVPNIFPWISVPQLGLRFKPIKQMEARLGIGFALTGFWFGLSADYGLERRPETTPAAKTGSGPSIHFN